MNPIDFKATVEVQSSRGITTTPFDVFFFSKEKTATFIFDKELKISKSETSLKFKINLKDELNNPMGFIVSRMERLAALNPSLISINLDGKTIYLKNDTICKEDAVDTTFIGKMVLPSDASVVVSVVVDGEVVDSITYTQKEITNGGLNVDLKTIKMPQTHDTNGFPMYCRNTVFNKIISKAMIGCDEKKLPSTLEMLSKFHRRLYQAALVFKDAGEIEVSELFIKNNIVLMENRRWNARLFGDSDSKLLLKDIEFYNIHSKSGDSSLKFNVDDLLALGGIDK